MHTSVHGVGHTFVQAAFKAFDLRPPFAVEEQKDPDPEFPTVKYPNPEEGKGVLVQTHTLTHIISLTHTHTHTYIITSTHTYNPSHKHTHIITHTI